MPTFTQNCILYISLAVALIAFLVWFCYDQNNRIVVTKHSAGNKNLGIKILQLSDLHSKQFGKGNKKLLKKVKAEKPNIIVFTGDLINDKGKNINKTLGFVSELSGIAPLYYVPGNHEHRLDFFDELMLLIEQSGAVVLRDASVRVTVGSSVIEIAGLDENQASFKNYAQRRKGNYQYKDYTDFFDGFCRSDGFKLVLTHYPENFAAIGEMSYNKFDFDLMLAGHAHGGQFILPFVGSVYSPGQGLFPKYARGEYGTKPKLIVSRGLGNSEFPLRLFNHPEIVTVDI